MTPVSLDSISELHHRYFPDLKVKYRLFLSGLFPIVFSRYSLLFRLSFIWPLLTASPQDYFQQEVNYHIDVSLDDRKHELSGFESIEYINNSPDTLSFIYFHLWPNAYSDNNTELARQLFSLNGKSRLFNDPELKGFIDSLDFKVAGKSVQTIMQPGFPDICKIILNSPLYNGDTIIISTPFHVKLPSGQSSLLGHNGESYNISQWYPKPAVYDRSGWHQMPYLDQGEFFSEFGNFDVSITLPSNYLVAATGNLQNEEEKRLLEILSADKSWMLISHTEESGFPPSSEKMKTLRYTENQVHDFAWFADKRFHVIKGNVKLPDSGRIINTWVMFTSREGWLWKDAVSYVNSSIEYFSKLIGDYPYNSYTAVQSTLSGGAGMEYPGLSVIGLTKDPYLLEAVIAHEICHSWFYSALANDERRFPFMDESIVGEYELRYMHERFPDRKLWEFYPKMKKLAVFFGVDKIPVQRIEETEWLIGARSNSEQAINLAAADYNRLAYNTMVYNKGASGFTWLRSYLGDALYDSVMHKYYDTWKNRHPAPDDLRSIFESCTGKDLSWFFDDFLGTTKRLDYKISRFKNHKLLILNHRELIAPFLIAEISGDSILSETWIEGFEGKKWIDSPYDKYSEIKIDPEHKMPELYRLNNNIRATGIWRKRDKVKPGLLYNYEDPDKRSVIFTPMVDWNSSDKFMAGMAIHNGMIMPKPIQYIVLPLYKFSDRGFAGYGKVSFNIIPYDNIIRSAKFTLEGSQFGAPGEQDYRKGKIGLDLWFRSGTGINPVYQKGFVNYIRASNIRQIELLTRANMLSFFQLGYMWKKGGIINPFNILISLESGKSFQKTSFEMNYKYSYYGLNNGLEIRLFAGTMLKNDSDEPYYSFSPSGRSGRELYLYPGIYPDRFGVFPESFFSRQMEMTEGGLVTPVYYSLGFSRSLYSFSLSSTLPGKVSIIPVKPFFTLLMTSFNDVLPEEFPLFYEAGFKAGLWNFFEIYFPLFVSDNIKLHSGPLKERIRFVFKLDIFRPI